jgi:protein TonB
VDGGFRYIGGTVQTPSAQVKRSTPAMPGRIHVDGEVQAKQIIDQKLPPYPPVARQARVSGKVLIHAVIGKDGLVQEADVIQGVCILAEPSLAAVMHWTYKPTLLNGEPVEVDTTITVTFSLE